MLTATAIAAVLIGSSATTASSVSASPRPALPPHTATRSSRPDRADWEKIKSAAWLRDLGLAPHRTAHFRSLAGYLGLSQLEMIQPLAPGRCQVALTYLYGNLLDLRDAEPGENWAPLRRFVANEPSIRACAPRRARPHGTAGSRRTQIARRLYGGRPHWPTTRSTAYPESCPSHNPRCSPRPDVGCPFARSRLSSRRRRPHHPSPS